MNQRHKHADSIIAWANGAEIEVQGADGLWYEALIPLWNPNYTYRIKPKPPVKKYHFAYLTHSASRPNMTSKMYENELQMRKDCEPDGTRFLWITRIDASVKEFEE
jgi:hypothetical protein